MSLDTLAHREDSVLSDPSVANVTEHLTAEFAASIDRGAIGEVVLGGLHDLQCSPAAARVVGLERLARDRLRVLIDERESQARSHDAAR